MIPLRYERGATVITTNRDEQERQALIEAPLLASAAMDRLLHHSHVVHLEGDSYRSNKKRSRKKQDPKKVRA